MKKSIIVALFCFFGLTQINAQVTFRPGVKAGLNFSHFTKGDNYNSYDPYGNYSNQSRRNFDTKTDFYIGLYGALKLSRFYTLQPEINYSRQGASYDYVVNNQARTQKLDVSYLSLGIANKFTFDKFNFHVGPTIDFVVEDNFDPDSEVDLAFFLGAGYNFTKNFGIEARIKKGIVPVLDFSDSNHTNVVIQTGITYTFDVK
ncbi:PorT family protein [Flavobacterium sp. SM15]|uniref:outer membrane beta-barrel protein n=1 Tax=Flavobacterium sp. SM15 TaxID=2908005 RepID=UPI001EDBC458|nr:outer membrane beta-barrel protein [Flavobacterium sp. SM15]MCG2610954.1 PorT family protein [Flavobacterium sp. SM15]